MPEKPTRKPIGKKKRFEVFKRDGFKCQYCGSSAPEVILHIDHIKPVAAGGNNGMLNLITSCESCNLGKGKRLLSDISESQKSVEIIRQQKEKLEQAKMILKWRDELSKAENFEIESIAEILNSSYDDKCLNMNGERIIRNVIQRFGFKETLEAAEIAIASYSDLSVAIKKIGGICYNRRNE